MLKLLTSLRKCGGQAGARLSTHIPERPFLVTCTICIRSKCTVNLLYNVIQRNIVLIKSIHDFISVTYAVSNERVQPPISSCLI